jgi:hypothetical protein
VLNVEKKLYQTYNLKNYFNKDYIIIYIYMIDYIIIIVIFCIIMVCVNKYYTRTYYKKNEIEPFINSRLNDLIEIDNNEGCK